MTTPFRMRLSDVPSKRRAARSAIGFVGAAGVLGCAKAWEAASSRASAIDFMAGKLTHRRSLKPFGHEYESIRTRRSGTMNHRQPRPNFPDPFTSHRAMKTIRG